MHLVLYRKQFSHVNPSQLSAQMSRVAREKGAVTQARINTVTIERKKFSVVYEVFRALYSSSRLFSIIFMFLMRRKCTADGKRKMVKRSSG